MSYQGRLLSNDGAQSPVTGSRDIVFSLWDGNTSDTGAVQLWSESWSGVTLTDGIFSVLLGSNGSPLNPADFQTYSELYLQLEIDGETLSPRQQLGSSAFAIVDEPDNELQDLTLDGDILGLTQSAVTVDLSSYKENTDDQQLSLSGVTLSLEDGGNVDLSNYLDNTDAQDLTLSGDTLSLSGDASPVDLSGYLDNTDSQDLSLSGNTLSLVNGGSVSLSVYLDNTDEQDLSLSGDTLSLSGDASPVDLSAYKDNTDTQDLSLSGNTLSLVDGGSVDLELLTVVAELQARLDALENYTARTVFVTSTEVTGNMGGLDGADATCQSLAEAAGLSGTFKAWLSDSNGTSPATRFNRYDNLPYELVDGTRIADDWADLTDKSIQNPISLDEYGVNIGGTSVYTFTAGTGVAYTETATYGSCEDWTSDSADLKTRQGYSGDTGENWTLRYGFNCSVGRRLYCFN